jgi:hypothetical protein
LEGAYRAVKERDDLLYGIMGPEKAIALLVELQAEGRLLLHETNCAPDAYIQALDRWEAKVTEFIREHYSSAELHAFRSFVYFGGAQYMPKNSSEEWLAATERKRIQYTARIAALDETIKYGSGDFLGTRLKLEEWMERHQ